MLWSVQDLPGQMLDLSFPFCSPYASSITSRGSTADSVCLSLIYLKQSNLFSFYGLKLYDQRIDILLYYLFMYQASASTCGAFFGSWSEKCFMILFSVILYTYCFCYFILRMNCTSSDKYFFILS